MGTERFVDLIQKKKNGETLTKEEIDFTVDELKKIVERLRSMSPLYEDFVKSGKQ